MTQPGTYAGVLQATVAKELRLAQTMLEQLSEILVADEEFALRFLEHFQTFDLVIQQLGESAGLLEKTMQGVAADEAVSHVRLSAVQDRFRTALDKAA